VKSTSADRETDMQQATTMTGHGLGSVYISQAHCLESHFTFYGSLGSELLLLSQAFARI